MGLIIYLGTLVITVLAIIHAIHIDKVKPDWNPQTILFVLAFICTLLGAFPITIILALLYLCIYYRKV